MNELPQLITIQKAAKMLGVTPLTLRNWDKAGKLKPLRHPMNNYRVYKRQDIENIIRDMNTEIKLQAKPEAKKEPVVETLQEPAAETENIGPIKLEVRHEEE